MVRWKLTNLWSYVRGKFRFFGWRIKRKVLWILGWIKGLPGRMLYELGYMKISEHKGLLQYQKYSYEETIQKIRNEKLDNLVNAIRSVNMIKVRMDEPNMSHYIKDINDEVPDFAHAVHDYPPDPIWYGFTMRLDVARIQRIYQERTLEKRDSEFSWFVDSILHDLKKQIEVLMRMRLGV